MSKTPEQVAEYALKHMGEHGVVAGRVIRELRSAGWLREDGSVPLEHHRAEVARMTRERDEARQLIAEYRKVAERYEANTASPEVLRVSAAALAYREICPYWFTDTAGMGPAHVEFGRAVDALASSRQPKAQEPRYEVVESSGGWQEGGCVRSIKTQELVFGCWRQASPWVHEKRCIEECERLNREGGKS